MPACHACGGLHVSLFGHQSGKQRYRCRTCHKTWRDNPQSQATDPRRKALILAAYHERMSMRGLARTFGVSRNTVSRWLKKASRLPPLSQTLVPAQSDDVLELDEMWSFVRFRKKKRWVWLAQCRRTRQVVAYAIGGTK